jgi:hypothetical protein
MVCQRQHPHTMKMTPALFSLSAVALLVCSLSATAATVVDTGTPNGLATGAYALDSSDFYAGQVSFASGGSITAISTHVLGATAGETFSLALYSNGAGNLPGNALYVATATLAANGWNGALALSGWTVAAGTYWVAVEVREGDTAGTGSATGSLLDKGAPAPLARTAFNDGSGYAVSAAPLSFGLRIEGTVVAVPEPAPWALMAAGLGLMALKRSRLTR